MITKELGVEIKQALEHCLNDQCDGCPYLLLDEDGSRCKPLLFDNALDYIEALEKAAKLTD